MAKKWIAGAIEHPGALTRKAKAAHMSLSAFEAHPPKDTRLRQSGRSLWPRHCRGFHHPHMGHKWRKEKGMPVRLGALLHLTTAWNWRSELATPTAGRRDFIRGIGPPGHGGNAPKRQGSRQDRSTARTRHWQFGQAGRNERRRSSIVAQDVRRVTSWELERPIRANGRDSAYGPGFQWKRGPNHPVERILRPDRVDKAVSSRGFSVQCDSHAIFTSFPWDSAGWPF